MKPIRRLFLPLFAFFLLSSPCSAETIRIIAEDDWYPFSAKFDGGPQGLAVDLVRAAFEAAGVTVEFDVMNYDLGMGLVKDGDAIGCFDAPRTSEVEEVYLWHDEPLFDAHSSFYARPDFKGEVHNVTEAAGKKVGLTQGYGYGDAVDSDTGMVKEYSKSDTILIKKLLAGRLDLIILFDMVADYLAGKLGIRGQLADVGHVDLAHIYVAFSKKHPEGKKYRDLFSEGFRKIKENGTYQRLTDGWDAKLRVTPADPPVPAAA